MSSVRLTTAQALVRLMAAQKVETPEGAVPMFAGVWAIFGHGNVAGLGEALHGIRDRLPTLRAHNEQAMVHAATAYAKAARRRRMMACATSIGPGALNMVTGAAVAHVNRLPVLLLPADVFASRLPDPVLQQIEDFGDGTATANDALRPFSRYFDRLTRPEQLMPAFARAIAVLTDPAECGPVTLALCQDVQTEAFEFPQTLFAERVHRLRRSPPDALELEEAVAVLKRARHPVVVAGGGVLYSGAEAELAEFCAARGLPAGETQAGKSTLPAASPMNMGGIGVSGTSASNQLAADADVVLAVGTRLQDFTTGSRSLFGPDVRIISLNTQPFDARKHAALPLVADARAGIAALSNALGDWRADPAWTGRAEALRAEWLQTASGFTALPGPEQRSLPSDAQVIGVLKRSTSPDDVVVCAAGGLPAELQKHWRPERPGGYHMEYGFSCMGFEIAGALGVKMAAPEREVIVMVGDGSYMMLNSEIATSVMLGVKLLVLVLDNHGFGCIDRLQRKTGGVPFNNLWQDSQNMKRMPAIDFAGHARSLGALGEKVVDLPALSDAIGRARSSERTHVIVIDTDPATTTEAGGHWWDVSVPEVSSREQVRDAHAVYVNARAHQRIGS